MISRKIIIMLLSVIAGYSHSSYAKKTVTPYNSANVLMTDLDRRLQKAVVREKYKKVHSLIQRGANVNSQDGVGFSPLHLAALYGNDVLVKLLLEKGALVDLKNDDKKTPLLLASAVDNIESIKLLIDAGADVTVRVHNDSSSYIRRDDETVLHYASKVGNKEIVKLFFEKGAGQLINSCSYRHKSPLHYAVGAKHAEIVEMLLEYGADPLNECNSKEKDSSPLAIAKDEKILNLLIENGRKNVLEGQRTDDGPARVGKIFVAESLRGELKNKR